MANINEIINYNEHPLDNSKYINLCKDEIADKSILVLNNFLTKDCLNELILEALNIENKALDFLERYGVALPETRPSELDMFPWEEAQKVLTRLGDRLRNELIGSKKYFSNVRQTKAKKKILKPFQVNKKLMRKANTNAIFMHCLPVGRGEEVTDEVIDGKQSVVWRQALNRVHAQKSIIKWCLE